MGDTVQQIKDRLSIVDVVSGYVKLERSGQSLRARCPFHAERTPSFFVSPERGTYHCFGCGVGGDIFAFIEEIEGLDFKGALKLLAEKAGVPLVYEKTSSRDARSRLFELLEAATIFYASHLNSDARKYLMERGLNEATIKAFRLGLAGKEWSVACEQFRSKGFSEKEIIDAGLGKKNERGSLTDKFRNRIMFPISDSAGRVIAFSGRIFGEAASPEAPKYLNSPETPLYRKSQVLYGFDRAKQAIRKHNFAVLVEGQMDLLASHQSGWVNTVAVSGTAFTREHALLLSRLTQNLVIALDADEAGIKAAGRAARAGMAGGLNVKVAQLPDGLDPADLIVNSGVDAWRKAIREAKDIITFLLDVLEKHAPQTDKFRRNVEAVVLPFVADVQSPIAREQYIREIAGRLQVSEQAVSDATLKLPRSALESVEVKKLTTDPIKAADRTRQAFALLLWQESLDKPSIDLGAFSEELRGAIGSDALEILRNLPDIEKEPLRFSAEDIYGKTSSLKREATILIGSITKDKLAVELRRATIALQRAEAEGDEKAILELIKECKLLTNRIAQIHE
ncbi:MAG TPA: DNA primase [Candidatus Paceibacterota bacterium]